MALQLAAGGQIVSIQQPLPQLHNLLDVRAAYLEGQLLLGTDVVV